MIRLACLFLLMASLAVAQNPEVNRYLAEARKALAGKDYPAAYDALTKAYAFHPYHQAILYNLGVMAAATGRPDESIPHLRKALHVNAGYKLDIPELATLKDRSDFQELLQLQKRLQTVVTHSDTAFVLKDRSLHVESVAIDAKTGTRYVGSVHKKKIVAIDNKGQATDFIAPGAHGLTAVLGLRVDPRGKFLWACSSPMEEMDGYDSLAPSRVFQFELPSGKLIASYEPPAPTGHVLGDLAIGPVGQVFVSDSRTNEIYVVNEATKKLDRFLTDSGFWNIQGITFTDDGKYLFISDYIKGPYRLELLNRNLIKLDIRTDNSLKGIDGLLWHKNSLLALQNGTSPLRVMRFMLNNTLDTLVTAEIIDQGRPELNEPTQGVIVGNEFYFVGNSQWGGYGKDHKPKPNVELQDIVVLKYKLR